MTYHDASTRFGDRAHFPSMGSQLPKHIPGRGPGICLLEESQANPYGNRWFRGTWNSRYRKVGTAQFRMRICFLWGKLLGWFSFAKEKSRLVNQNYLQCSEFAEIYWYLFDCNFAKIFAWLNWPWLKSPMKITMFHQDFLQNFSGGDGKVEPFSAGDALVTIKALGGVFPRKFIRFLSSFRGFGFRIFQTKGS